MLIIAICLLIFGVALAFVGFAGSMSDAPSGYDVAGKQFVAGLILAGLALIIFAVKLGAWVFAHAP